MLIPCINGHVLYNRGIYKRFTIFIVSPRFIGQLVFLTTYRYQNTIGIKKKVV